MYRIEHNTLLHVLMTAGDPSPGAFTAYRASGSILTFLVWLLLFAVVAILMIMLLYVGAALAINTAITSGRR